jgi:hypothetical protein
MFSFMSRLFSILDTFDSSLKLCYILTWAAGVDPPAQAGVGSSLRQGQTQEAWASCCSPPAFRGA